MRDDPFRATTISRADGRLILALRLLLARAAAPDSLNWWDDEALTEPAAFILERTFPHSPPLAARRLALLAAAARHAAAAEALPRPPLHLYHLDWRGADELALRDLSPLAAELDPRPIPTLDELRRRLLALTGAPGVYRVVRPITNGGLIVAVPPAPAHVNDWRHRAAALAWAYTAGAAGQPVIPLISDP